MATMIIASIGLVLGFVIFSANGQNRLEVESSTKLAETALTVNKRHIAGSVRDYAVWEDAYRYLHETFDFEWAATDGNVGANIFEGLGYEMAFVLAPGGRSVYAVLEGVPQMADAYDHLPHGLAELARAGVEGTAPAVALLRSGADVYLVAAAAIMPPSVSAENLPPERRSALVFVQRLDELFIERMSNEYLLQNLAVVPADAEVEGASLPLLDPNEELLANLTWSPEQPGFELLRLLLPPLALCLVVLAIFAWAVLKNARKSAIALQDSARIVETYAQTLQDSEARFRDVAEVSSDWIWECDPQLNFVYLSTRFSEVTGIAAARVLGKPLDQFFFSHNAIDWKQLLREADQKTSFRDVRCSYRDAKGLTRTCRLAGRPIFGHGEDFAGFRGTATDITEEVEAQTRAKHLALHDALTGLPNRVLFRDRLELALSGPRRPSGGVAVLCLDLDKFKEVNDTLGHGAGDQLLQEVSKRLQNCVRIGDTVARLGGDEFAIIQTGVTDVVNLDALGHRIVEAIKLPFHVDGQELHIGVSVGVAFPDESEREVERLMKSADIALYRAKQAGRGTVRLFEPKMDIELQARKTLESDLRHAILRNEFEVHYQPLVDLETNGISVVEALVRWKHPLDGTISPDVIIPVAEETGLITAIDAYVLRTACTQVMRLPDLRVAVNLSPVNFRQSGLVTTVQDILQETGLDPSRLELEITESVLINDTQAALETLTALKSIGVKISLDDFGTGYSSLSYLNAFPFDKIKIDRSFISSLKNNGSSSAIVSSVIGLGKSLAMLTTAEGVETRDQVEFLIGQGCHQVQGYFVSEPIPADELPAFFTRWQGIGRRAIETAA